MNGCASVLGGRINEWRRAGGMDAPMDGWMEGRMAGSSLKKFASSKFKTANPDR